MGIDNLMPDNTIFVLLSFEGPDVYSQAGGLGIRVTHLSQALARGGFTTHLFFIGDPYRAGEETSLRNKLVLHRWGQWISAYYPLGAYHGENEKLADFNDSLPPFLQENIIRPALRQGKIIVVMAEEWQTAEAVCRIHNLLAADERSRVILFWNANNIFGFDRIDFARLSRACTITTVSRYMKHIIWRLGLNPIVIPNGIPRNLLNRVDAALSGELRKSLGRDLVLTKIARWDPDKRWNMALEAAASLKSRELKTVLIARGGLEGYGQEVLGNARSLGLNVMDVETRNDSLSGYLEALTAGTGEADFINLKFFCPQEFLRLIYHAADAVLANSGREPFGLVGLEAMAAGGIVFTGSTGEDYAIPFYNSIVLETADPKEIETYVMFLKRHPEEVEKIRKAARYTAGRFTWEQIVDSLVQRLECQAKFQGLITLPQAAPGEQEARSLARTAPSWK